MNKEYNNTSYSHRHFFSKEKGARQFKKARRTITRQVIFQNAAIYLNNRKSTTEPKAMKFERKRKKFLNTATDL
jgi:hypothetical protein